MEYPFSNILRESEQAKQIAETIFNAGTFCTVAIAVTFLILLAL